jgi:lysophospholipase L1-like esterase
MTGFDSITEDGGGDAYRDELGAMITVPHRFAVTALSGSRCTHWAPQMSELLVLHNPAVVLINCGTNDPTATLEDRELLGQSYRQIIEAIHTHNPNIYIIASKIQISRVDPEGSLSWLPDSEIRANEVIDFNVGYYIPAWPTVGLVDFSTIEATEINNPDGIHPGPAGQQLYADLWFAEGQRLGAW